MLFSPTCLGQPSFFTDINDVEQLSNDIYEICKQELENDGYSRDDLEVVMRCINSKQKDTFTMSIIRNLVDSYKSTINRAVRLTTDNEKFKTLIAAANTSKHMSTIDSIGVLNSLSHQKPKTKLPTLSTTKILSTEKFLGSPICNFEGKTKHTKLSTKKVSKEDRRRRGRRSNSDIPLTDYSFVDIDDPHRAHSSMSLSSKTTDHWDVLNNKKIMYSLYN
ncbi:hypothetical protein AKO1_007978 [Acrasis kona]|uniref:Uncharacterized protein n=1 Tax=Acrasis kona TaxID=1008807 RepID=A0AAW2YPK0_9EUKA